jgi:transcriptional/translational regulatory protein YebC/TACO1
MDVVLGAGADDLQPDGENFEVLTDPKALPAVQEALEKDGYKLEQSEVRMIPDAYVPVGDKSVAKSVMNFVEALEEHDDVQAVYHNMDVSDAVMAELEKE